MFQTELYKLCHKKITGIGFLCLVFIAVYYFYISGIADTTVVDGGKTYQGMEAVRADREIARPYQGLMTMDKAEQILDKYGYADTKNNTGNNNFCNDFVTRYMTNSGRDDGNGIHLYTPEESGFTRQVEAGAVTFGYTRGWSSFLESYILVFVCLCIYLSMIITPVFSEEYALRTAGILLTTAHGKKKGARMKYAVCLSLAVGLTLFMFAFIFLMYGFVYGFDGLKASACLMDMVDPRTRMPVWSVLALLLGCSVLAAWMHTCITIWISSCFRQPFLVVILSVLQYLAPWAVNQISLGIMPISLFSMWLRRITTLFPFYLLFAWGYQDPVGFKIFKLLFFVAFSALCLVMARRKYSHYQAGR